MIRIYKPTTASRRKMSVTDYSVLTKKKPEKKLTNVLQKKSGRNNTGHITVRHQGGGNKRKYRQVMSLDQKLGIPAKIESVEYDPNRTAFISLVTFEDGVKAYILAWEGIKIGQTVNSGNAEIKKGNRLPLVKIPNGIGIYDIELQPGQGGKMVKTAGGSASIVAKEGNWVHVKLSSGEVRKVNKNCFASIGQVSNVTHSALRIGKAGRKRHMGIRPTVRGKAMHPAAHPHGGGEGVNPIGLKYPKTPWGKHALGVRTRKKNKYSAKLIIKRRKK